SLPRPLHSFPTRRSSDLVLRPRDPLTAPGARFAQASYGADPAHLDPPARPIPSAPLGLGAPAPRRRHSADRRPHDPSAGRARVGPRLANTSRRTTLASRQRQAGLNQPKTPQAEPSGHRTLAQREVQDV